MKRRNANRESLADDLARLSNLDRSELAKKWRELYRTEPPARMGSGFLVSALAYRVQEQALGGLKPATQRYLARATGDSSSEQQTKIAPPTVVKPGTRLLREWHGVTHEVVVLEVGVRYRETHYRSLSEVACTITGTRWSGPLFFGLRSVERKRAV